MMSNTDTLRIIEGDKLNLNSIKIKSKYDLTLKSWFEKFVAREVYPDYSWDICDKVANCIMKTKISLFPKYLIIQLMRFESVYTATQTILTKNDNFVSFPIKDLDLSNICNDDSLKSNCNYNLYGVVHHSGTMSFGHYYSTIRSNLNSEDWYMFNGKNTDKLYDL